jgi:hypothetical protein
VAEVRAPEVREPEVTFPCLVALQEVFRTLRGLALLSCHQRPSVARLPEPLQPGSTAPVCHQRAGRNLAALRAEVEDLIDLGQEATRKKKERVVSRAHIRGELERTGAILRRLLRAGRRGLPAKIPATH